MTNYLFKLKDRPQVLEELAALLIMKDKKIERLEKKVKRLNNKQSQK